MREECGGNLENACSGFLLGGHERRPCKLRTETALESNPRPSSFLLLAPPPRRPPPPPPPPPPSYQSSLDVLLLAGLAVLGLAPPGLQGRGLQGAAEGEGEGPGPVQNALVHGVQVDGGLLLALTARQEGDSLGEGQCEGKGKEKVSQSDFLYITSRDMAVKCWSGRS